jgi:hypothetical protein
MVGSTTNTLFGAVDDVVTGVVTVCLLRCFVSPQQVEGLYQDGGFNYGGTFVRVWHGQVEDLATTFLEPENGHFWRQCIYGRGDDHVR